MNAKIFWGVLAVAFLALVGWRVSTAKQKADNQKARAIDIAVIRTTKVAKADLRDSLAFTGNIRARNEVDIFPKIGGRIESLRVAVGDRVRAGDLLAVVEHKEIGWQARAAAAQQQSAAAAVQAAQAGIALAQTNIDGAKQDYDRTKTLFDAGSAPQAQLDGAKLRLDIAKAQAVQVKAQLASAQAAVAQTDAAAGLAQQQIANARIESPISGVVTKRNVLQGTQVGPQTLAFSVQELGSLKLEGSVDAAGYVRLARGKPVTISVEEFPGEAFKGRIDVLSPALDPSSRRANLEILIDNHTGRLLPQMFAHADAEVGILKGQLSILRDAVLDSAGTITVYRVKDGHVEAVHPKLGVRDGSLIAVLDGLFEGDELALSGLGNLTDGLEVKVAPAIARAETPTP